MRLQLLLPLLVALVFTVARRSAALQVESSCCAPDHNYDASIWACVPDNATDSNNTEVYGGYTTTEVGPSVENSSAGATSEATVTWGDAGDTEPATGVSEDVTTDWDALLVNSTEAWAGEAAALTMVVPEGCDRGALVDVPEHQALPQDRGRCLAGGGLARVCVDPEEYCGAHYCLPKCCPHGQSLMGRKECRASSRGLPLPADLLLPAAARSAGVALVAAGLTCIKYPLQPDRLPLSDQRSLVADPGAPGRLALEVPAVGDRHLLGTYCLEYVDMPPAMQGVYAFVCFPEDVTNDIDIKHKLESVGLVLSVLCLAGTLSVYAALPTLQNLHGRTLMCHISALLAAYIGLAVLKIFTTRLPQAPCTVIGVLTLFFFLAAFSWLTIMCFDIWWTFGRALATGAGNAVAALFTLGDSARIHLVQSTPERHAPHRTAGRRHRQLGADIRAVRSSRESARKNRTRRLFALYSAYAWGVPTAITAVAYYLSATGKTFGLGRVSCFLQQGRREYLEVFSAPVGAQLLVNMALFALTARCCWRVKADLERMAPAAPTKRKYRADLAKVVMNAKLFVVMGLTFTLDVVSGMWVDSPQWLWYIPDTVNVLQGVFISAIFVLKRRVLRALARRLGLPWGGAGSDGGTGGANTPPTASATSRAVRARSLTPAAATDAPIPLKSTPSTSTLLTTISINNHNNNNNHHIQRSSFSTTKT